MSDHTWRDQAACRDYNPDWWFPEPDDPEHHIKTRAAQQICTDCPIQQTCATYAAGGQVEGIWAGRRITRHHIRNTYQSPLAHIDKRQYQTQQPCGTPTAAQRHRYNGEKVCEPCRLAYNEWAREYINARRAADRAAGIPRRN